MGCSKHTSTTYSMETWMENAIVPRMSSYKVPVSSPCHCVHPSHSRKSRCSCGCTLPSRVSALEMARAGIALMVLVLAVLIVVAVAISPSRHDFINGGRGPALAEGRIVPDLYSTTCQKTAWHRLTQSCQLILDSHALIDMRPADRRLGWNVQSYRG